MFCFQFSPVLSDPLFLAVFPHGNPARSPGLKVKLLVGPTCKIPTINLKELFGNKANLRCAKFLNDQPVKSTINIQINPRSLRNHHFCCSLVVTSFIMFVRSRVYHRHFFQCSKLRRTSKIIPKSGGRSGEK